MTLESKEIPNRWWRVKSAGVSSGAQEVLRAVLRGFLEGGQPPSPADLSRAWGRRVFEDPEGLVIP